MPGRVITAVLILACGCGGRSVPVGGDGGAEGGVPDGGRDGVITQPEAGPVDGGRDGTIVGSEHQFVIDQIDLPTSSTKAKEYAFDLDHNGTLDNQYGNILAALASAMGSASPQATLDTAMSQGRVIHLLAIYAASMQDGASAGEWEFLGQPAGGQPQPGGTFVVDTVNGPADAYSGGSIAAGFGQFGGDTAIIVLNIPVLFGGLEGVVLHAARLEFQASADGLTLTGRIGGALTESDVQTRVIPQQAAQMDAVVSAQCTTVSGTCVCQSGSGAETIQSMFDTDGNCHISVDEVANNNIIKAFLKGDVMLADGSKGLSLGVGFHAVHASFAHAAPPW